MFGKGGVVGDQPARLHTERLADAGRQRAASLKNRAGPRHLRELLPRFPLRRTGLTLSAQHQHARLIDAERVRRGPRVGKSQPIERPAPAGGVQCRQRLPPEALGGAVNPHLPGLLRINRSAEPRRPEGALQRAARQQTPPAAMRKPRDVQILGPGLIPNGSQAGGSKWNPRRAVALRIPAPLGPLQPLGLAQMVEIALQPRTARQ